MPELPELEVLRDNLNRLIGGKELLDFQILKPYIQKTTLPEGIAGQQVTSVFRRGKYIGIDLERHRLIVHLMLAGRLKWRGSDALVMKSAAAVMRFEKGMIQFVEEAKLKRMGLWIVDKETEVDYIKPLGVEPFLPGFSLEHLTRLLACRRERLKSFLVNQRNLAGIGNAYSDEICWEARLSPFRPVNKLTPDEGKRVYNAIGKVLKQGIQETRKAAGDGIDIPEKRVFMKIHRHKDEPCPRCGTRVAWVSTTSRNTYYCPRCQTGGRLLKDGRTSKFLK